MIIVSVVTLDVVGAKGQTFFRYWFFLFNPKLLPRFQRRRWEIIRPTLPPLLCIVICGCFIVPLWKNVVWKVVCKYELYRRLKYNTSVVFMLKYHYLIIHYANSVNLFVNFVVDILTFHYVADLICCCRSLVWMRCYKICCWAGWLLHFSGACGFSFSWKLELNWVKSCMKSNAPTTSN